MQNITIDWFRLLRYSLLFLIFSMLVTLGLLVKFSENLAELWEKGLMLTVNELVLSLELSLSLLIYVSFPLLLFRFLLYFAKMLYRGRNPGIGLFCYQTLFNPLNFLLFPSLLNPAGLNYRRRCVTSLILLIALYFSIFLIT